MGECHHLHLKGDTLLLTDVFENFRKMSLVIYELDPAISLAISFKKTKVELELVTDIKMLLMVEKGIREEICHACYSSICES